MIRNSVRIRAQAEYWIPRPDKGSTYTVSGGPNIIFVPALPNRFIRIEQWTGTTGAYYPTTVPWPLAR